jgi:hypothetical protein
MEEQRVKLGLPDDWPHAEKYEMTDEDWAKLDAVHAEMYPDYVPQDEDSKELVR